MSEIVEVNDQVREPDWQPFDKLLFGAVAEERATIEEQVAGLKAQVDALAAEVRVRPSPGGDWLDAREAGALIRKSRRAIYAEIERNPDGQLAQAMVRIGHRLRFSRAGIERMLSSQLQAPRRPAVMRPRVPSPPMKRAST